MKAIVNGKIILGDRLITNKVLVFDKKIIEIADVIPKDAEIIDAEGNVVSTGLIDVHIHGCAGVDTMDATPEALRRMSRHLVKEGVTSFLPTTMTMSQQRIKAALENIKVMQKYNSDGATILGCHLEGPYISATYKGAQNEAYIQKPTFADIEPYVDLIKIITLAPEEDEGLCFIKEIKEKTSITLSLGHTATTFTTALAAIDAGVSHATHTFNGMSALNHREPGAVGAILSSKRVKAEIIADTIHVNPGLYQWFYDTKGANGVILITDSIRAGGMPEGVYDLGGQDVIVKNKTARLMSGSLAGSVLTLNQAMKNYLHHTTLTLPQVFRLATLNPAEAINVSNEKGSLDIGKDADIVVWSDELLALQTYIKGNLVYKRQIN